MHEPSSPPTPIPQCYWVVPGRFLAGEYPRNRDEDSSREKLDRLLAAGVTCFVDMTTPHDGLESYDGLLAELTDGDVAHERFPVPDLSVPVSPEHTTAILDRVDREIENEGVVYLHCWGGIGRTGTLVGCWLVRHGMTGDEALRRVAELWARRPDAWWSTSPQVPEQFRYVREWREGGEGA